ncbi:MAG TPA: prepilin peptidase [Idiomarina baltica]|jgi:leader peptidase (prepilin peptidase)/N-methyltransferase|uniref:Prepilin leader peptidase/N-methyltransferase n=1 Tax=Idiomarina baltica TaxID=190892 RepID=A0A348WLP2_9GAMM|nr:A24 family peptidase [Idiomarina baltica]MBR38013.1 prepilin peptidase [Idiomarina sp.]HAE89550.1 prepilin peptidase [Idiomarina sp.]HAR55454.1 prepilin peptidase [Idiomarina baltica]|tara:strand:- start:8583 stop:9443 length:861 start_codon:yes stop_codon:yes gene_type:complete
MDVLLAATSWQALLIAGLLGASVGSFLNVVIARLPKQLQLQWKYECAELAGEPVREKTQFNIAVPGSHCPKCQHSVAWYDNIPILSYLVLRAQCRHCNTPIPIYYWLVEVATTLIFLALSWQFGLTISFWVFGTALSLLIAMTVIDYQHQLLPDNLTYPLLWLALLWSISPLSTVTPSQAIIGAVVGYLSLWSLYWVFKLLTGKEGMGYGDFKLLAALSAFTGVTLLPVTVIFSAVAGILIGLAVAIKHKQSVPIPFGPFLAIGGVISYLWGETLLQSYWQWLGVM